MDTLKLDTLKLLHSERSHLRNREQRRLAAKENHAAPPPVISKAQQEIMESCTDTIEINGKTVRKVGIGFAAFKAHLDEKSQHYSKTGKFREAKFSCGDCKACCHQRVEIFGDEPASRLQHLDIVPDEFGGPDDRSLRRNADGSCVHLGEHGCTVYEHRPTACRAYDCRMYNFYGITINHEFGGTEPIWHFDKTTREDQIIGAALELLVETYQGPPVIEEVIIDRKRRIESAIVAMRGQFELYDRHLASMTPNEREQFENRMRGELIEYEESKTQ